MMKEVQIEDSMEQTFRRYMFPYEKLQMPGYMPGRQEINPRKAKAAIHCSEELKSAQERLYQKEKPLGLLIEHDVLHLYCGNRGRLIGVIAHIHASFPRLAN